MYLCYVQLSTKLKIERMQYKTKTHNNSYIKLKTIFSKLLKNLLPIIK